MMLEKLIYTSTTTDTSEGLVAQLANYLADTVYYIHGIEVATGYSMTRTIQQLAFHNKLLRCHIFESFGLVNIASEKFHSY